MKIRIAKKRDLRDINIIANQAIKTGVSNAYTEPLPMSARRKWFKRFDRTQFPVFVAEKNEKVIGWLAFSPYRGGRDALRYTTEISYYVHEHHRGEGVGSKMVEYAIEIAPDYSFKNLFAIILDQNAASISLLKKFGFEQWAYLPKVADFWGKEMGQVYYGIRIKKKHYDENV